MRVDLVPVPSTLLGRLADLGVDVERVLRAAGIAPSRFQQPKARVTTGEYFAFWDALEELEGAADLGFRLGSAARPQQYDVVSMTALHSANVGEALKKLARYKRVVCPEQVAIEITSGEARLQFIWELARQTPPEFLIDATFTGTLGLIRRGTEKPIAVRRVELTRRRQNEASIQRYLACPVRFDAPNDLLVFDESVLSEAFVTHNSDVLSLMLPGLEDALAERSVERNLLDDARAALRRSMSGERPSVEGIARELGMSARTLQRRLESVGKTYQGLLDEVRHDAARHLLSKTDVEAEEVAYLLGFEEMNSFTRAFHGWEGTTPKQWRGVERKPPLQS